MATVVQGDFEWDGAKDALNQEKHDVTFAEATTVFDDPLALYADDGAGAQRLTVIGFSALANILTVVCVERGERTRIISARRANKSEVKSYGNQG